MNSSQLKYLKKKPKHRFPTGSRPYSVKNRSRSSQSSMRLNISGSLGNRKNEVLARKLERERIRNIIKAKQSGKKSVTQSKPRNNGLPRPHTSASSKSRKIVIPNMYNLMEKGTSTYRPSSRSMSSSHIMPSSRRMPTIQENVEQSTFVKKRPTTFNEYFQNVANEAHEESTKLNAEERFGAYMSSLKNEIAAENQAERMEHERIKSERNQLRRNKKENKSVKYSVKAHRQLLDSYMPVHQVFNKRARTPTSKGKKLHR